MMINAQGKSKVVTESTTVITGSCRILGMSITAGTDSATVKLLDGVASDGTQKVSTMPVGTSNFDYIEFTNGIQCATGIYATVTGTTPEVAVYYED